MGVQFGVGQASSAPAPEPSPPSAAARQAAMDQRANAPPLPKVIDQLRDGAPLCHDFQTGRCSTRAWSSMSKRSAPLWTPS